MFFARFDQLLHLVDDAVIHILSRLVDVLLLEAVAVDLAYLLEKSRFTTRARSEQK